MGAAEYPPNRKAIEDALTRNSIPFAETEPENDEGWALEILDRVDGAALAELVRVADTSDNVILAAIPNIGLVVGTKGAV